MFLQDHDSTSWFVEIDRSLSLCRLWGVFFLDTASKWRRKGERNSRRTVFDFNFDSETRTSTLKTLNYNCKNIIKTMWIEESRPQLYSCGVDFVIHLTWNKFFNDIFRSYSSWCFIDFMQFALCHRNCRLKISGWLELLTKSHCRHQRHLVHRDINSAAEKAVWS